jgi:hypothetical protein
MKKLFAASVMATLLVASTVLAFELPTTQPIKPIEGPNTRYAALQPIKGTEGPDIRLTGVRHFSFTGEIPEGPDVR